MTQQVPYPPSLCMQDTMLVAKSASWMQDMHITMMQDMRSLLNHQSIYQHAIPLLGEAQVTILMLSNQSIYQHAIPLLPFYIMQSFYQHAIPSLPFYIEHPGRPPDVTSITSY